MTKRERERKRKVSALRAAARRLGYFLTERDSLYVGPGISVTINSDSKTIGTVYVTNGASVTTTPPTPPPVPAPPPDR